MRFKLKDAQKFEWPGLKGWSYNSKENFDNASAAYFEVTEKHGKVKTTRSDRIYFVIDGKGEFTVNDKIFAVEKNDVIIIPKNTFYDYRVKKGILKLFLVHTPAYHPDYEVRLKK